MSFFSPPPGIVLVPLVQRTPEWHAWRDGKDLPDGKPRITATMAAIVAGDSVTKSTPTQLWEELTGRRQAPEASDFLKKLFARGTRMEPVARAAYEDFTGNRMEDICVQAPNDPWAGASLDGLTSACDLILEVKCPISSRVHAEAKAGRIPSYYVPQMRWQLLCCPSANEVHFWSWFPDDATGQPGALVTLKRDPRAEAELLAQCLRFRSCLVDDTPPVEDAFKAAALAYRLARADADFATSQLEAAEATLKESLAQQDLAEACGVRLTRFQVKASVDYSKALLELGLPAEQLKTSLEAHRKPAPVDYEAAWKALGAAAGLTPEQSTEIEAKCSGNPHTRHRITVDPEWTPSAQDVLEVLNPEEEPSANDWNW
jgi:putative phage-type endonuclease